MTTFSGGAGNDLLDGGEGRNILAGGDDNDTLRAGSGLDILDGGAGEDTVDYSAQTRSVSVNLRTGEATGVGVGTDTLIGIKDVIGSSAGDTIIGNGQANTLDGQGGVDIVIFSGGPDSFQWFVNPDGSVTVNDLRTGSPEGTDLLRNVEVLEFDRGPDAAGGSFTTAYDIGNSFFWSTGTCTYDAQAG